MPHKEQQFIEAYHKYSNPLYRYCYFKISDQEIAKDMTQQTFAKVWEYMKTHDDILNLRAFLYKILSNLIIDEYRKRRRVESLDSLSEKEGFEPSFDDTESWMNQCDGRRAFELIKTMPQAYQETLNMRFLKGLSLAEIAQATGKQQNAIAVCIHRGLNRLRILFFRNAEGIKGKPVHAI